MSVSPFGSVKFCFMYLEAVFPCILFKIVMSSWWINSFILIKCLSSFLAMFLFLKLTLTDINIFSSALLCLVFSWYSFFFILLWLTYCVFVFTVHFFPFPSEYNCVLFSKYLKTAFLYIFPSFIFINIGQYIWYHYSLMAECLLNVVYMELSFTHCHLHVNYYSTSRHNTFIISW